MDIDALFDTRRTGTTWRDGLEGETLKDIEELEARIEQTRKKPNWTKLAEDLTNEGYPISAAAVGDYYRKRYPFLKRK